MLKLFFLAMMSSHCRFQFLVRVRLRLVALPLRVPVIGKFAEAQDEVHTSEDRVIYHRGAVPAAEQVSDAAAEAGVQHENVDPQQEVERVGQPLKLLPGRLVHVGTDAVERCEPQGIIRM